VRSLNFSQYSIDPAGGSFRHCSQWQTGSDPRGGHALVNNPSISYWEFTSRMMAGM
jgi:hypothetical protein